jgi:CheY-like chemotaxis protein/HPt (histidine-containing phosphotransfer) domain-containing protein
MTDSARLAETSAPGMRPGLRVLLAEDNAVNRTLIVLLLERQGHRVTVVGDGRAAVNALIPGAGEGSAAGQSGPAFDVVLMDVLMPEMDGFEATALIREREKGTGRHVLIIALTAHSTPEDRERCLKAGMDGYVSKPIQARELFAALQGVLGGAARAEEPAAPAAPAPSGFDRAGLLARVGGREERLRKIARVFLDESAALLRDLREALAAGDAGRLRRAAHSLKGAVGIFGAEAASRAAQHLESLGDRSDLGPAAEAYAALEGALAPLLPTLAEVVREP